MSPVGLGQREFWRPSAIVTPQLILPVPLAALPGLSPSQFQPRSAVSLMLIFWVGEVAEAIGTRDNPALLPFST